MMVRRAHGLDFSYWCPTFQMPDNPPIPIDFAVQRVSVGLSRDARYNEHSKAMQEVPFRMAYHYYYMDYPWKRQVDLFLECVNNNPHVNYHAIWWDFEEGGNQLGERMARETAEAIRYLRAGFDGVVGIYANVNDYLVGLQRYLPQSWLDGVPFWVANPFKETPIEHFVYGVETHPRWAIGNNTIKRPYGAWDMWQVSFWGKPEDYGVTGKKQVDVDVFNGTPDELGAWLGIPPKQAKKMQDRTIRRRISKLLQKRML